MNSVTSISLPDPDATARLGAAMADALVPGQTVYLRGELGAGKTALVRGLLRAMGHSGPVKSPTYTLIEPYSVASRQILHCDLYRLADPGEMDFLGLADYDLEQTIVLIEWPDQGLPQLPRPDLEILLEYSTSARMARLKATDSALILAIERHYSLLGKSNRAR